MFLPQTVSLQCRSNCVNNSYIYKNTHFSFSFRFKHPTLPISSLTVKALYCRFKVLKTKHKLQTLRYPPSQANDSNHLQNTKLCGKKLGSFNDSQEIHTYNQSLHVLVNCCFQKVLSFDHSMKNVS